MRLVLPSLVSFALFGAAAAHADPAPCAITIARAPDDVRATIESWVAAEPRCATALEVRIVPTDGGLYLFAEDGHGRIRERVVPDAQSAGVLIASWAADDGSLPGFPSDDANRVAVEPPSSVARQAPPRRPAPAASPNARWASITGMSPLADPGEYGVRAELDLVPGRAWSFGLVASVSAASSDVSSSSFRTYRATWTDVAALGVVARTFGDGPLRLRAELGGGAVSSTVAVVGDTGTLAIGGRGWYPVGELAVVGIVDLGRDWGLVAGPILGIYGQTFSNGSMAVRRTFELSGLVGIRRRL